MLPKLPRQTFRAKGWGSRPAPKKWANNPSTWNDFPNHTSIYSLKLPSQCKSNKWPKRALSRQKLIRINKDKTSSNPFSHKREKSRIKRASKTTWSPLKNSQSTQVPWKHSRDFTSKAKTHRSSARSPESTTRRLRSSTSPSTRRPLLTSRHQRKTRVADSKNFTKTLSGEK